MTLSYSLPRVGLPLAALGLALVLRLAVAGSDGPSSASGGLVFAAALIAVALAGGWRPGRPTARSLLVGVGGASVLVAIPAWLRVTAAAPAVMLPWHDFALWAPVVSTVALAEEILLRGLMFDVLQRSAGPIAAALVAAIAFALLHVPLYGPQALPVDLAVGLWLGALRLLAGSVAAPATAHVLADLAGWWLI